MDRRGRILGFLVLNIVVSALTTTLVINLWLRNSLAPQAADAGVVAATSEAASSDASNTESTDTEPTATSAPAAASGDIEIVTIIGPGDLNNERLQVRYSGESEQSLAGWQLFDEDGNTFVFPGLTMYSGGAVTVYTAPGVNTVVELYWGLSEAIWTSGETATLVDQAGGVRATYTVP